MVLGYEVVQLSPVLVFRKIFEGAENNQRNEYHFAVNGKPSDTHFNSIEDAVKASQEK